MPFSFTDYDPYDFANRRHIGPSPAEMEEMLATIGVGSLDALIDATVPSAIRQAAPLDFGPHIAQGDVLYWFAVLVAVWSELGDTQTKDTVILWLTAGWFASTLLLLAPMDGEMVKMEYAWIRRRLGFGRARQQDRRCG